MDKRLPTATMRRARLASRTAGGVTTSFLYDGADVVLDRTGDGSAIDYLNGAGVDNKLRQTSGATGPLYFLQTTWEAPSR